MRDTVVYSFFLFPDRIIQLPDVQISITSVLWMKCFRFVYDASWKAKIWMHYKAYITSTTETPSSSTGCGVYDIIN